MIRPLALLCGVFLFAVVVISAQPQNDVDTLPRRGWFGVALGPHESGAVVTAVADGSTAAVEGIRAGDVIRAVDGSVVRAPEDVIAAVTQHAGGEVVAIDLMREGQPERRTVVLRPLPRETMPGVSFQYGSVTLTDGSRLRTIISVPDRRQGRLPAVMLIQGGGCGSVDIPIAADVGQSGLIRTIAAQGYVTMRVEKSGVGDSHGPPCTAIGYSQELDGYRAALAALTRHPSVDPGRVSLLGISLGGVFAPLLAAESRIQSIVVYGTLAAAPPPYPGRSERFFREFATVDIPAAWSAVESRVLALRGQFDELATEADQARIAAIVNARRTGRATYQELPGLDHCWTRHETVEKSRGNCGNGEAVSALSDAVIAFLGSSSRTGGHVVQSQAAAAISSGYSAIRVSRRVRPDDKSPPHPMAPAAAPPQYERVAMRALTGPLPWRVVTVALYLLISVRPSNAETPEEANARFVEQARSFMAGMQEESRRDAVRVRAAFAASGWDRVFPDRAAMSAALLADELERLPADAHRFNLAPRLTGAHPIGEKDLRHQALYVAAHPGALGCLLHLAARVESTPLEVTSLVRHSRYQRALQRTNVNARTARSTHTLGVAFDISILNIPLSAASEIRDVLRRMRDDGDLFFIAEQRQLVFHVVPRPERLDFYAAVFHGMTAVAPPRLERPRWFYAAAPVVPPALPPLGRLAAATIAVETWWPVGVFGGMFAAGAAASPALSRTRRRAPRR